MDQILLQRTAHPISRDLQTEIIRKSIHVSIALVPTVVALTSRTTTLALLALGTLLYAVAETSRRQGHRIPIISRITELSSRGGDRFALGPVTLGLGAMLALMLYPDPAATIAIYAMAFGDSAASVVGKLVGRIRIPGAGGKTVEGSLACGLAVATVAAAVTGRPEIAVTVAIAAMVFEALPTRDADNLVLPAGVGLVAAQLVM